MDDQNRNSTPDNTPDEPSLTVTRAEEAAETAVENADETAAEAVEVIDDEETQQRILADSDMNGFERFIAGLDDAHWKLYQRIGGVVLGLLAAVALFWDGIAGSGKSNTWSLVIAIVIAMLIPNIIERQGKRRINTLRTFMVITLAVAILAFFLYLGAKSNFTFKSA